MDCSDPDCPPSGTSLKIGYTCEARAAAVACHGLGGGGWLAGAVFFEKVCLVKGKFLNLAFNGQ